MKVVITGSAGFVGTHIVEHLLINTDWKIIGLDSFRHKGDSLRITDSPKFAYFKSRLEISDEFL